MFVGAPLRACHRVPVAQASAPVASFSALVVPFPDEVASPPGPVGGIPSELDSVPAPVPILRPERPGSPRPSALSTAPVARHAARGARFPPPVASPEARTATSPDVAAPFARSCVPLRRVPRAAQLVVVLSVASDAPARM